MKIKPSILIVDDNLENLLFLETALNKLEVILIKATSAREALGKTEGVELALAIIDVRMPEISGYELAVSLNETRNNGKIPVIFLTAMNYDETELFNGYKSGAVDYLYKPVDHHILLCKTKIFIDLFNQKQTLHENADLLKVYSNKLSTANSDLKKSEEKYKSYIDNDPDGVFVTDEKGNYLEVNEAACRMTGYSKDELIRMSMSEMLIDKSVNDIAAFFDKLTEDGSLKINSSLKHKDGLKKWIEIDAVQLSETRFLGFVKDITVSKLADDALRESEDRFRSFFELIADLMVIADIEGYFRDINSSWTIVLGYSKEELLGKSILQFIHPDDLVKTKKAIAMKLKHGETIRAFENRYMKKDGGIVWLEWTSQPNILKGQTFAIARDITKRKIDETELKNSLEQLHQLTNYIEKVRENERIAISRELHDDLGQALTAIKIDLGIIKQSVVDTGALSRINKVSALVGETIKTVQRLTSQLRPQILEDLGLDAAIEWHTKEFEERYNIEISLDLESDLSIPPDASLTLFRIMQESLTNIARHSEATKVHLKLNRKGNTIIFKVSDNGIGISESQLNSKKSFGLIGMKERATSLGGTLEISNKQENGTQIKLVFPVKT